MYLVLSRDMDNVVIHVQFPATLEEVRRDISRLDEYSAGTGPVRIVDTSSLAKNLTGSGCPSASRTGRRSSRLLRVWGGPAHKRR